MEPVIYNFDQPVDRTGTQSIKNDRLPNGCPENTLSMGIADMDYRCAQPILDALHRRVEQGIFGYSWYDSAECKAAVTGWFLRRFDWHVAPEELFYSPGIVPALGALTLLLTEPGDGVLVQRPVYYPFSNMVEHNGRHIVDNTLRNTNGVYTMDFDDLDRKLADPSVKMMILCSPHNPVGRVWTEQELRRVVETAKKYGKWIVSDEIHFDLTRKGVTHTPLLKLCPEYADHIVVCTAPSKSFNVAGMQLSNIVIPNRQLQQRWTALLAGQWGINTSNALALTVLMAAYNESEDWLEQARSYIDGNVAFAADWVKQNLPKATLSETQGTYLLWLDLRAYCADAKELERRMLAAGLSLDEGYIFGDAGAGFERINAACTRAKLAECLTRLQRALA